MSLKIIAGEYGSRVLKGVKGNHTRPLLGQVREALFNIVQDWTRNAEVWDLFAGTGASGIEALSRGARRVIFVEKSNQALAVLRSNLDELGPTALQRSHVLKVDAWEPPALMLDGDDAEVAPDLVFYDPPYKAVAEDPVRAAYKAQQLLKRMKPGGILCFHFMEGHLDRDDFDPSLDVDLRSWGTSVIALIEVPAAAEPSSDTEPSSDPGSTKGMES